MLTKRGICRDLPTSPYTVTIDEYTFYFSSKMYQEAFKEAYQENRQRINESLSNRFNVEVELNTLADFVMYKKIEKRGFYVEAKESGAILCQRNNLKLSGAKAMKRN